MEKAKWIRCPVCGSKTRDRIREDTVLINYPLYCPKCKPDYFIIKAYLVENETYKPLCTEYTSPNYTKEMQEFFAKTTDDFEEEKVLNLDEDNTNNFAVYNDDIKLIEESSETNVIVSADDDNLVYVLSNIDDSVRSLNTGNIFSKKTGDNEILIVKVSEISIENDTAMERAVQHLIHTHLCTEKRVSKTGASSVQSMVQKIKQHLLRKQKHRMN